MFCWCLFEILTFIYNEIIINIFPFSFRDLQSILKNSKELSLENFGLDNVDVNKYFRLSGNVIYYVLQAQFLFYFALHIYSL